MPTRGLHVVFALCCGFLGCTLALYQNPPYYCYDHGYASVRDCNGTCMTTEACFTQTQTQIGQDGKFYTCLDFLGDGLCDSAFSAPLMRLNCSHLAFEGGDCLGMQPTAMYSDPADIYPPALTGIYIETPQVDVTYQDATVTVKIAYEDDLLGISQATIMFKTTSNDCQNFPTTIVYNQNTVEGDKNRGNLTANVLFPQGSLPGNWSICYVRLFDDAPNTKTWTQTATELENANFVVINTGTTLCSTGNGVLGFYNLTGSQGEVSDGSGQVAQYVNNMLCEFLISPTHNNDFVELVIDYFALELSSITTDYVQIFDGENDQAPLMHTLKGTGSDAPPVICSTGPKLFVRFVSDSTTVSDGFSFTYTARTIGDGQQCCGDFSFPMSTGVIGDGTAMTTSYVGGVNCTFRLAPTSPTNYMTLNFEYLNLQAGSSVSVSLMDGSLIGSYTGTTTSFTVCKANVTAMLVVFIGGSNTENRNGFKISFESGEDYNSPCNGTQCQGLQVFTNSSGQISDSQSFDDMQPYQANSNCEFLITPTEQSDFIHLHITSVNLGTGDFLEVYDGSSTRATQLANFGRVASATINLNKYLCASQGNALYIRFSSDSSNQGLGFSINYYAGKGATLNAAKSSLNALYQKTSGSTSWKFATNWNSSESACDWYGVTCACASAFDPADTSISTTGSQISTYVSELQLVDNRLVGTFPPEFFSLTTLRQLQLSGNAGLTGSIPSQVGKLSLLKSLDLSSNSLKGTIPSELATSGISGYYINLKDNQLSGSIPSSLLQQSRISILDVSANSFSQFLPDSVQLQNLVCEDTYIFGKVGNQSNSMSCSPLRLAVCGDGIRSTSQACSARNTYCCRNTNGVEGCDDGNNIDGDGCNSLCEVEPGWTCVENSSLTSSCAKIACEVVSGATQVNPHTSHQPVCGDESSLCGNQLDCSLTSGVMQAAVESGLCATIATTSATTNRLQNVTITGVLRLSGSSLVIGLGGITVSAGARLEIIGVDSVSWSTLDGPLVNIENGELVIEDSTFQSSTLAGYITSSGVDSKITIKNSTLVAIPIHVQDPATIVLEDARLESGNMEAGPLLLAIGSNVTLKDTRFNCTTSGSASSAVVVGETGHITATNSNVDGCVLIVSSTAGANGTGVSSSPLNSLVAMGRSLISGVSVTISGTFNASDTITLDGLENVHLASGVGGGVIKRAMATAPVLVISNNQNMRLSGLQFHEDSSSSTSSTTKAGSSAMATGVRITDSTVQLSDVIVQDFTSESSGGCLSITRSTVVISGSALSRCSGVWGGAINVGSGSAVTIDSTYITQATAQFGGGIYAATGALLMSTGMRIHSCNATCTTSCDTSNYKSKIGGAVLCDGCAWLSSNDLFEGNEAQSGGALAVISGGLFNATGTNITANTGSYGGGLFCTNEDTIATLVQPHFVVNIGTTGGAAYASSSCLLSLESPMIEVNYATTGGAVYVSDATANIWGAPALPTSSSSYTCVLERNVALNAAASVVVISGQLRMEYCRIERGFSPEGSALHLTSAVVDGKGNLYKNNTGSDHGGAVACDGGVIWNELSSWFQDNTAPLGGAMKLEIYTTFTNFEVDRTSYMILDSCVFTGNNANNKGGALQLGGSAPGTFTRCNFTTNIAGKSGGAIFLSQSDNFVVSGCYFENNIVENGDGGALSILDSSPLINASTVFQNNTCMSGNGGAISALLSTPTLHRVLLSSNAALSGGGLFSIRSTTTMLETTIEHNSASVGGGMYSVLNAPVIVSSQFNYNSANTGGGLFCFDTDTLTTITDTTFKSNSATGNGGAIVVTEADVVISWSTFESNSAQTFGGGVSATDCTVILDHVTATENVVQIATQDKTTTNSGGFFNGEETTIAVANSRFSSNKVVLADGSLHGGGGAFYAQTSTLHLLSSSLDGNEAELGGAVLVISAPSTRSFTFSQLNITSNKAWLGGAIYMNEVLNVAVDSVVASDNIASVAGGGFAIIDCRNVSLSSSTFSRNTAAVASSADDSQKLFGMGGGIAIESDYAVTGYGNSFVNNQALNGGGAVFASSAGFNWTTAVKDASGNKASFGSNIASAQSALRLDTTATELSVVYGETIATEIIVAVVDHYGNVFASDNDTVVEVSSNTSTIVGQAVGRSQNGKAIFDSIGLQGTAGQASFVLFKSGTLSSVYTTINILHKTQAFDQRDAVILLFAIGIIGCIICHVIVFTHKKHEPIHCASHLFCQLTLFACTLGMSAILPLGMNPSTVNCSYTLFSGIISFNLLFAALSVKTYRIWRFFSNKKLRRIVLRNIDLLKALSLPLGLNLILLIVMVITTPPEVSLVKDNTKAVQFEACNYHETEPIPLVLITINAIMMASALFLAVKSRNADTKFNESKLIGYTIYNVVTLAIILVVFLASITTYDAWKGKRLLLALGAFFIYFGSANILFVPKIIALHMNGQLFTKSISALWAKKPETSSKQQFQELPDIGLPATTSVGAPFRSGRASDLKKAAKPAKTTERDSTIPSSSQPVETSSAAIGLPGFQQTASSDELSSRHMTVNDTDSGPSP